MASSTPKRRAVLLTRPLEDSRALAEDLAAEGIAAELWPLTAIRPLAGAVALPAGTEALLFTSAHAARAFAGLSARRDLPALCVGAKTAAVARGLGFSGAIPAGGDAEALSRLASATGFGRFFHPRGRDVAGDIAGALRAQGLAVAEAVLYAAEETGPPPAPVAHALAAGEIGLVTIWSRRNAEIFARRMAAPGALSPETAALAISEAAADPLRALPLARVCVASEQNAQGMRAGIRANL